MKDTEGKPRGYAFIEFEREKDMKAAYKDADGIKILGRRIVVDVERGRTVKGWRPKRLGKATLPSHLFPSTDIHVRPTDPSDIFLYVPFFF